MNERRACTRTHACFSRLRSLHASLRGAVGFQEEHPVDARMCLVDDALCLLIEQIVTSHMMTISKDLYMTAVLSTSFSRFRAV
uniref:Uncharacterized protein n=1 Tax=Parascaris equorum TaxID=6256 RepID=A0A914RGI4_PAREQ